VQLGAATQRALRALLPAAAVVTGPVDTCAVVTTDAFRACVEQVAADDGVDAVLAVAVPTAFSDLSAAVAEAVLSKPLAVAFLDRAESVRRLNRRPVAQPPPGPHPDTGPATGGPAAAVIDVAAAAITGVPCYADPGNAARALGHAARYRAWRGRHRGQVPELEGLRTADARTLVTGFLAGSPAGGWLPQASAAELVSCYGISLAATMVATTEEEAAAAAAQLGGSVVLKAEAEGLTHRAGAGGVKADLRTPQEVTDGYRMLAADSGPWRVLVQPMLEGGVEVMIGVAQEPVFGPLVVFGSGDAATEVPGDHVTRLTPLTDADAQEMIHAVQAAPLLAGDRGTPPADTAALADALLRVSRLADDLPEVSELDLNPVLARPDGVWCVDVRVRISPAEPRDPFLRRLL
jgi:acyl-CoA synthetase (NDP forming)